MEKLGLSLLVLSMVARLGYGVEQAYMTCCTYCRSEPQLWMTLAGAYQINTASEYYRLKSPAAFLSDDTEEVSYKVEGRDYKLSYGGAPIKLTYSSLNDMTSLIAKQYIQVDMASTKHIGGVMIQGGFYEEKVQGLIPYRDSWVTDFVISYSDDPEDDQFTAFRTPSGIIETFQANFDATTPVVVSFPGGVEARYLRLHPLKAQNANGAVDKVTVRVTAVTCGFEICVTPRINCLLTEWSEWGDCTCGGAECSRSRAREIRRVQACGGTRCGALNGKETCTPPEPTDLIERKTCIYSAAWKSIVQYVGIALAIVLLIGVIAFIIYRKKHKDRVEVIVVKENDGELDDPPVVSPSNEKARPFPDSMYRNFEQPAGGNHGFGYGH